MEFLAQGSEVLVVGRMEDAQGVVVAADDDAVEILYVDEGLSVEMDAGITALGNEDFDFGGVGDGDGAVGHGLGADGHEGEGVQACLHDGAAGGKGVGGGAGGGGDDEAVGALGIDEFLVDEDFELYHLACTAAREDGVVEGEGAVEGLSVADEGCFDEDALFGQVFAFEDGQQLFGHVFAGDLGEEA